ncbi:methyltransferase family protein [Piscinibacter terrae]|uniref:Isoprenylcysteine carboxylmethyltransferase family protein n=1 Tax=Piscinibacter terrae TaxID=2496871 RepID=A0A3N7HRZ9_9BURK|nr:isoprenylcysteine carboxylmethyltransferase family protein [Albitalea terrae]RQP25037.1 isoprenylcysteine carboxylmethyltransferase family protein [Albitalea terrae]
MPDSTPSNERKKVGMLIPPPFLLIGLVVASTVAQLAWFGHFASSIIGVAAGVVLLAASLFLLGWSASTFKQAGTPVRPTSPAVTVVREGPYRFSRNPMYVGMAGLLAGFGLVGGSWFFAAATLVFVAVVHFGVILPEERYLEALHGQAYQSFKAEVRRWV